MLNVVCMLMGTGIPDVYVVRLASMLKRHMRTPYRLHVITDKRREFPDEIVQIDASTWSDMRRDGMRITTNKIRLFDPEWIPFDEFLYMDVTLVIQKDMQSLVDYCLNDPHDLVTVRDWSYDTYNSCLMRIRNVPTLHQIYHAFQEGKKYEQHTPGDQDFVHACIQELGIQDHVGFFKPEHIESYKKLRMRSRKNPLEARQRIDAATIVKFHGRDKMHLLLSPVYRLLHVRFKNLRTGRQDSQFWIKELRDHWR